MRYTALPAHEPFAMPETAGSAIPGIDPVDGGSPVALAGDPETHAESGADCQKVRTVLDRVGEKWSILTIRMLGERPYRFNELRRTLDGITQRMLTLTLRSLERDGLVTRTVTATIPPSVEYGLTPLGRSLRRPIEELTAWALEHHDSIVTARQGFDTRDAG